MVARDGVERFYGFGISYLIDYQSAGSAGSAGSAN